MSELDLTGLSFSQRDAVRQEIDTLRAELERVRGERDAARAAAGAWKRAAKTRYRVEQYVVGTVDSRRQWQETKEHFCEAYND